MKFTISRNRPRPKSVSIIKKKRGAAAVRTARLRKAEKQAKTANKRLLRHRGHVQRPPAVPVEIKGMTYNGRKILSYSLFQLNSNDTRALGLYHRSTPAVIRAALVLAPKWEIMIHHDDATLQHSYGHVLRAAAEKGLIQLRRMESTSLCKAMLWRLRPIWFEENVDIVACRDMDSIFMGRDRLCLEAFASSDSWAHCIADNVAHSATLMGGMSAYRARKLRELFPINWERFTSQGDFSDDEWKHHGTDQDFLARVVWSKVAEHTLVHRIWDKATSELPTAQIPDVDADVLVGADTLTPYIGAAGFDVERAMLFYDKLPATQLLRDIETQVGWKT